ncbi:flavin monoamine oxidase family protein [Paracoccus zhejiangensis]|uniref:Amine oxidase n=1 Tax=Paracoccus zhejiangensis TaxID=1077935 RepID=A0A2H5F156_9RHOB|nr:FAD-dependent oxidoreductase [Paracoccus zhejiangensis]AUH65284.1 amine oxidase [Paracoccus zhejiangensis]
MSAQVLVIGGGLAGLTAARALHRAGIGVQLIEARGRLGGRILSVAETGEGPFDLGPSWFWPDLQPDFARFVQALGVACFPQADAGDLMFQRGPGAVQRYPGMYQEPASMRMVGGTASLISALARDLPPGTVRLNAQVTHLTLTATGVDVTIDGGQVLSAPQVLLALPPRLLAAQVTFDPPMPVPVTRLWQTTPTWMAPHAKFVAVYDRAFWRDAGLSGAARSQTGPLAEIHDATTAAGQAALFGFVGLPAEVRARAGEAAVIAACLRQLGQLFGPKAAEVSATHYKHWAADPLTATPDDLTAGDHPSPILRPWVEGDWQHRLTLIGSETSRSAPGYLAGAHEAAEGGVATLLARRVSQFVRKETPCA